MYSLLARLGIFLFLGFTSVLVSAQSEPIRPSIAATKTVNFIGKNFELKFQSQQQAVPVFEYFLPNEAVDKWSELIDFRVYPVHPSGNEPMDHAVRTAKLFKQQYPYMQLALYSDSKTGAALLDFFYPTSTRKDGNFIEFNAFKFFRDASTQNVMSFHYAKNIPGMEGDGNMEQVSMNIKATRAEVIPAIAKFPLYRP
jgi:hypothetical protein